jgi:hypothetical protein
MLPTQPPQTAQLDIVTAAITLITWMFSAGTAAEYIGLYAVIILSAVGGATYSASAREVATRWRTLCYVVQMVGLAMIATVPIAELVAHWTNVNQRWLFAPVAVVIAARPYWVVRQFRHLIEARTDSAGERGAP